MTNTVEKRVTLDRPQPLPWCSYAKAEDVAQHGLRRLPEVLPLVNYASAQSHRSVRYKTKGAATLEPTQILQMARVVATSFAKLEPMARHLNLPRLSSIELLETNHSDPYGTDSFGAWTKENLIFWMIRLLVLTDPTSPFSAIQVNKKVIEQSLVIMDGDGAVIGGAFNRTMPHAHPDPPLRHNDPFIVTVLSFFEPIFALLDAQDAEALTALRAQFHEFREAHDQGKVGYHFMVARSDTQRFPMGMPEFLSVFISSTSASRSMTVPCPSTLCTRGRKMPDGIRCSLNVPNSFITVCPALLPP